MKIKRLLMGLLLMQCAFILPVLYPAKIAKKTYKTKSEIRKLFNSLGVQYLESNKVNLQFDDNTNAYHSKYYAQYKDAMDKYQKRYGVLMRQHYSAPISIKWISDKVGFGVFAQADIKAEGLIQEYTGVMQNGAPDTTYYWTCPVIGTYSKLGIDSKFEGNEMRFVNHSNNPNAIAIYVIGDDSLFHVVYAAIRDIKSGEQILVHYGDDYWKARPYLEEMA